MSLKATGDQEGSLMRSWRQATEWVGKRFCREKEARPSPEPPKWDGETPVEAAGEPYEPDGWPESSKEKRADALIDVRKKIIQADLDYANQELVADLTNVQNLGTAINALATSSVERARAGAQALITASGAIVTLYTGVLALSFSASDNPLPLRGLLAPIFLGTSVALAVVYLAYLRPSRDETPFRVTAETVQERIIERANAYTAVTRTVVRRKASSLRSGVVALGIGVAAMPLAFVGIGGGDAVEPTAWPEAVVAPDENADLAKIRYAEQVKEVAEANAQTVGPDPQRELILCGIVLAVGLGAVVIASRDRGSTD